MSKMKRGPVSAFTILLLTTVLTVANAQKNITLDLVQCQFGDCYVGTQLLVLWGYRGLSINETITIVLETTPNGQSIVIASNISISATDHVLWTIPVVRNSGIQYTIRVYLDSNPFVRARSAPFFIMDLEMQIISPNATTSCFSDSDFCLIEFSFDPVTPTANSYWISLYRNFTNSFSLVKTLTTSGELLGGIYWPFTYNEIAGAPTGSSYYINASINDVGLVAYSSQFSITAPSTVASSSSTTTSSNTSVSTSSSTVQASSSSASTSISATASSSSTSTATSTSTLSSYSTLTSYSTSLTSTSAAASLASTASSTANGQPIKGTTTSGRLTETEESALSAMGGIIGTLIVVGIILFVFRWYKRKHYLPVLA